MTRSERVKDAWTAAYAKIAPSVDRYYSDHDRVPSCLEVIGTYAPEKHARIEAAERAAEESSVRWQDGGPGGVQAALDAWVALWLEGAALVST